MKYVVIGAGGTGGSIGGFLAKAGYDVTLIARGQHLQAIKQHGLTLHSGILGELKLPNIRACSSDEYTDIADVVFVTVKGYSLDDTIPYIQSITNQHSIVIPILNIYGTGAYLAQKLPHTNVISGCMYIVAHINAPGEITQRKQTFRIVYGTDGPTSLQQRLEQVKADLLHSQIKVTLSQNISADTYRKFTFISPYAATGAYFDVPAGVIQQPGKQQALFLQLVDECIAVGKAENIHLPVNMAELNRQTLLAMAPDATASMQKDLQQYKQSELDGLVFEVIRRAQSLNLSVPGYELVGARLQHLL